MSDNGGVPGMTDGSTSLPLRGNKGSEWDGGVRVPAAICWEAGFAGGRKTEQVTGFVDVKPTLAAIIGAGDPPRPYDGLDMGAVLRGTAEHIARDLYLGCGAAVNANYKMILPAQNNHVNIAAEFLADYRVDPYETGNHIASHRAEADRLRSFIVRYDTLAPVHPELPYGYGRKDFKAPPEWRVTKP
jgi:arylsulfatase A-like enzyme